MDLKITVNIDIEPKIRSKIDRLKIENNIKNALNIIRVSHGIVEIEDMDSQDPIIVSQINTSQIAARIEQEQNDIKEFFEEDDSV